MDWKTKIDSAGDLRIDGDLCVDEALVLGGSLTVLGDLKVASLAVAKPLEVSGDLQIPGDVSCGAQMTVRGACVVGGSLAAVDEVSWYGAAEIKGSIALETGLRARGGVKVGGASRLAGDVQIDLGLSVGALETGGFFNVEGDLDVTGDFEAHGFARVSGDARIQGALTALDDMTADGSLTVGGALSVEGSLTAGTKLVVGATLTTGHMVRSGGAITAGGAFVARGDVHANALTVAGDVTVNAGLYAEEDIRVEGNLVCLGSLFAKQVWASGDIQVSEETVVENVQRFGGSPPPLESIAYVQRVTDKGGADAFVEPDSWKPVVRRLVRALSRQRDHAAFLLGDVGVGKSALLAFVVQRLVDAGLTSVVTVDFDALQRVSLSGKSFSSELERTLSELSRHDRPVLLLDHIHYLSRSDWLVGELAKALRPFLLEDSMRLLLVTTPAHYRSFFKEDALFSEKITAISMPELTRAELEGVVRTAFERQLDPQGIELEDAALAMSITLGSVRSQPLRPPASSVRLLDEALFEARALERTLIDADLVREMAPFKASEQGEFDIDVLRHLEDELNKQVLGQLDAVAQCSKRIRLAKLGFDRRPNRPDGVFLLLGPSGVGKTELAKSITRGLYGDLSRLIRLDMSEYMAEHEYSKVIGSPPGYTGYGEEGQLTGAVSRVGHGVVLFDEIEKAHRSLLNLFLQIFDEGFLTDAKGKRVDFSRCVIIMTSNIGRELWSSERKVLGFGQSTNSADEPTTKQVLNLLMRELPAEFVNRIDELVPFHALTREDLLTIVQKQVREEVELWEKRGKVLSVDSEVFDFLVQEGYEPRLGARHLERNLERHVVQRISEAVLQDGWTNVQRIHVVMRAGQAALELS